MLRPILAVLVLATLAGCADLGYGANGPWDTRAPRDRRAPRYDSRTDDYRRTTEYRRVSRDAAAYASYVDRALRLNGREEAAIRQITERRAVDLLRRTRVRDHARVYPFPRSSGRNSRFWSDVDRDIERRLSRDDREGYRYLVRYGDARYRDRYDRRDQSRHDRDDRRADRRGRDDGERSRANQGRRDRDDRGRRDRDDDDRQDRARRDDDRRQRDGESLEDWYRRQGRRGD